MNMILIGRRNTYRKHSCDRRKIPMAVRRPTLSPNSSWLYETMKHLLARAFRLRPVFIVLASVRSLVLTTEQTWTNKIRMRYTCCYQIWCAADSVDARAMNNRICKIIQTILRRQELKELSLQCSTPSWTLAVCLCCTLWGWRMGCAWWSDCSRFGVGPLGLCAGPPCKHEP